MKPSAPHKVRPDAELRRTKRALEVTNKQLARVRMRAKQKRADRQLQGVTRGLARLTMDTINAVFDGKI